MFSLAAELDALFTPTTFQWAKIYNPRNWNLSLKEQMVDDLNIQNTTLIYTTWRTGNNPLGLGTKRLLFVLKPRQRER